LTIYSKIFLFINCIEILGICDYLLLLFINNVNEKLRGKKF